MDIYQPKKCCIKYWKWNQINGILHFVFKWEYYIDAHIPAITGKMEVFVSD